MYQTIITTICNIATTFWGYMRGIFLYLIQPFSAVGDYFAFSFKLFDGTVSNVFIPEIPIVNNLTDFISKLLGIFGIEFSILSCVIIASLTTFIIHKLIKIALSQG